VIRVTAARIKFLGVASVTAAAPGGRARCGHDYPDKVAPDRAGTSGANHRGRLYPERRIFSRSSSKAEAPNRSVVGEVHPEPRK
jgi:hypothetical protein